MTWGDPDFFSITENQQMISFGERNPRISENRLPFTNNINEKKKKTNLFLIPILWSKQLYPLPEDPFEREVSRQRSFLGEVIYAGLSLVEFWSDPLRNDLCDSEFNSSTGRHEVSFLEFWNLPDLYDLGIRRGRNARYSIPVVPQDDSVFHTGKKFKERNWIFAGGDETSRGGR
jgi:hypothetical protein